LLLNLAGYSAISVAESLGSSAGVLVAELRAFVGLWWVQGYPAISVADVSGCSALLGLSS
jgi:hypothetical protein